MKSILANLYPHSRDANIRFYTQGHKYEILTDPHSKYLSVTTWVKNHFRKFDSDAVITNIMNSDAWGPEHKYWGQTREEIKAKWNKDGLLASSAGTALHEAIELFMNNPELTGDYTQKDLLDNLTDDSLTMNTDWQYFLHFVKEHPELKPYRTEWLVFDEDVKIAGSIDMVYENPDGTLSIYDWKRSKDIQDPSVSWNKFSTNTVLQHVPDTNYWHYSLQLNIYKTILENKYNKQVKELFLVKIHPDTPSKSYELISVPLLTQEMTNLFNQRKGIRE